MAEGNEPRMLAGLPLAVLLLLALPVASLACRCAQQPLAYYYDLAEFVAMARLVSFEERGGDLVLTFDLPAAPYKGAADAAQSSVRLITAKDSASCGIQPDIDAIYVVFGYRDPAAPDMLRVDSCSGTRVHLSRNLDEPNGFVDVPARFVASQLLARMGRDALREVARAAPQPDDPGNDTLIGLLDLKALAHGGVTVLHEQPDAASPVVARIRDWEDVLSREVGYEVPAAIVYARAPGWYRLKTSEGTWGWAEAAHAGTWFPYSDLPVGRLAYMTESWDGLVWPGTGTGNPFRHEVSGDKYRREYPVRVLESTTVAGLPFFRVEVLKNDPCSGEPEQAGWVGWVPGYDRDGEPSTWYYSRGC